MLSQNDQQRFVRNGWIWRKVAGEGGWASGSHYHVTAAPELRTTRGTTTTTNGQFNLSVPNARATLIVSFVSYIRQGIPNNQSILKKATTITQHLMTCYPVEIGKPGQLIIHYAPKDTQPSDFVVNYDPKKTQPSVEKIPLGKPENQGIITKWGDTIYRINFEVVNPRVSDKLSFEITAK